MVGMQLKYATTAPQSLVSACYLELPFMLEMPTEEVLLAMIETLFRAPLKGHVGLPERGKRFLLGCCKADLELISSCRNFQPRQAAPTRTSRDS